MKIYIINENAEALNAKNFYNLTDEEIVKMHEDGSDWVDCYESIESLAEDWNYNDIFSPLTSYMRIINK